MKKRSSTRTIFCVILSFALILGTVTGTSLLTFAKEDGGISRTYGDFDFSKISNPASGSKEADGINTNDITGYPANRLNSYAWAMASRGNCIYIGTNRTLFGSSLNAVVEQIQSRNPDIKRETVEAMIKILSAGDVPVGLEDKDYIPQIIKFDMEKGSTEVIYQPETVMGTDGRLYYTDREGSILPYADVASETASFRSVIEYNGNLYFGSLGVNMLQLVRIDKNDRADVVFQTVGSISSLRACCLHNDGNMDTIYFGGQDATNKFWLQYIKEHPDAPKPLPIVIRYLDPSTAGTGRENWDGLVADFSDFGKYSYASVYLSGGGTVWDLCSYNGKLYLILAYDGGWAMFRGEKGGSAPNKFGWTWTEIVGDNGKYPLAMDPKVAELNEQYRKDYGCNEFAPNLTGTGLLESTATPYVYNGKMYIGTFDNATMIQAQTVIKLLTKLQYLKKVSETGNWGPSLTQIFAPIYEILSHPQRVWVMDENESISAAEGANALLEGTTNDYVWRFIEHNGKLYAGTFDASTAYNYFLGYYKNSFRSMLCENIAALPKNLQALLKGTFSDKLTSLLNKAAKQTSGKNAIEKSLKTAAANAAVSAEEFLGGAENEEQLLEDMRDLESVLENPHEKDLLKSSSADPSYAKEAFSLLNWLHDFIDIKGLEYLVKARKLTANAESGFDLFVTEDGVKWKKIVGDGLDDVYNYGARAFTILNNELYVGTANPYYGAQLWKVSGDGVRADAAIKVRTPSKTCKASTLKKQAVAFRIGASVNSKGKLSYAVQKYKNAASRKYLRFQTKTGKLTVKKGTPKGTYALTVKITARATANYKAAALTKTLKVVVK